MLPFNFTQEQCSMVVSVSSFTSVISVVLVHISLLCDKSGISLLINT